MFNPQRFMEEQIQKQQEIERQKEEQRRINERLYAQAEHQKTWQSQFPSQQNFQPTFGISATSSQGIFNSSTTIGGNYKINDNFSVHGNVDLGVICYKGACGGGITGGSIGINFTHRW